MWFDKIFVGICASAGAGGLVIAVIGLFGGIKGQSDTETVIVLLLSLSCFGVGLIVGMLVDCIEMLQDIKKHSR